MVKEALTPAEVIRLCQANYDRGGDYVLELMGDKDIYAAFCCCDGRTGRKKVYDFLKKVVGMRNYMKESVFRGSETNQQVL